MKQNIACINVVVFWRFLTFDHFAQLIIIIDKEQ